MVKNIAILHPTFNYNGGAENLILWTLEEFHKIGISTTVFTRTIRENAPSYIKQEYVNISINPFIFRSEAKKLLKKIIDFDAVIIHNFPATILWGYVYKEAVKQNIKLPKVYWYCHEPSVRLYGHDKPSYNKAIKTLDPVAHYTMALDKYGVSKIDNIFANSKRTASHIKTVYNREAKVIYPAIPRVDIKITNEERKHFLYVGRIETPKNLDTAIKAFKIFLEQTKNYNIKFLIAGRGSDKDRLVNIVRELGIEKNVEFLGFISNEEKINLLQTSYAMILPATFEPFGLTVIEAFTCNTIAILSKDTGVSEVVENACVLVDVSNTESLANGVIKVYTDNNYRNTLLEKSRELIKGGTFFIDCYAKTILECIKNS